MEKLTTKPPLPHEEQAIKSMAENPDNERLAE